MNELTAAQRRVISRGRRLLRDFADDFRIYRQRGMTNQQIAEAMGYRDKHIVSCLVARARRHGLLPRPTAADNRRQHADETRRWADQARHHAQTGGGL